MSFISKGKRLIAQQRINQRKREQKKIRSLALKRNKAIKEANSAVRKAQLLEDKKDAELRKAKAIGREPVSGNGRSILSSLGRELMKTGKALKDDIEKDLAPKKRRVTHKRKSRK